MVEEEVLILILQVLVDLAVEVPVDMEMVTLVIQVLLILEAVVVALVKQAHQEHIQEMELKADQVLSYYVILQLAYQVLQQLVPLIHQLQ
mgnify:CR=1 FL=1